MRVSVDSDLCQGHTICNMVAPEMFKLREEDGHAYVEASSVPVHLEDAVRQAALGCPERAITIED
jgi:ferredoxin